MYQFRSVFDSSQFKTKKSNSSLYPQLNTRSSSRSQIVRHVGYQLEREYFNQDNISEENTDSSDTSLLLSKEFPVDSKISHQNIECEKFKDNQDSKKKSSKFLIFNQTLIQKQNHVFLETNVYKIFMAIKKCFKPILLMKIMV